MVPRVRQRCRAQSHLRCAADGVQDPRLKGPLQEAGLDADKVAAAVKVPRMLLPHFPRPTQPVPAGTQASTEHVRRHKKRIPGTAGSVAI